MDIFEKLGIRRYINAHDTYTVYGGSRMEEATVRAMEEISRAFVDMDELQRQAGKFLAAVTGNEAAYVTSGAASAMQLCAAVCMAQGNEYLYRRLPDTSGMKNEILVFHCQHNCYDKAIEASGANVVLVGDADETLAFELEGKIGERTAAVFYFPSGLYERGYLSLEQTVEIAHRHGLPVVVDAAAQLPPVENLQRFTRLGADMVIFSGGKTLKGPQDSGLIVGKRSYLEDCLRFGAPAHGVCRGCKISREAVAGLCTAVEAYVRKDHVTDWETLSCRVDRILSSFREEKTAGWREERGPVGQTYPRAFLKLPEGLKPEEAAARMRSRGIYIGTDPLRHAVYVSPLNLTEEETDTVIRALKDVINEEKKRVEACEGHQPAADDRKRGYK